MKIFTLKELEEKLVVAEKNFDPNTKTYKTWYRLKFKIELKEGINGSYADLLRRKIVIKKENNLKNMLHSALEYINTCRWLPVDISITSIPLALSFLGKIEFLSAAMISLAYASLSRLSSEAYASKKIKEMYMLDILKDYK